MLHVHRAGQGTQGFRVFQPRHLEDRTIGGPDVPCAVGTGKVEGHRTVLAHFGRQGESRIGNGLDLEFEDVFGHAALVGDRREPHGVLSQRRGLQQQRQQAVLREVQLA